MTIQHHFDFPVLFPKRGGNFSNRPPPLNTVWLKNLFFGCPVVAREGVAPEPELTVFQTAELPIVLTRWAEAMDVQIEALPGWEAVRQKKETEFR